MSTNRNVVLVGTIESVIWSSLGTTMNIDCNAGGGMAYQFAFGHLKTFFTKFFVGS